MDFNYCIKDKNLEFWYAKGNSVMSGDEFHEFHEIIYIINANGSFLSEKEKIKLSTNMLILIPKETYHNFIFENGENNKNYVRCRIWFSSIPHIEKTLSEYFSKIRVVLNPNDTVKTLFSELTETFNKPYLNSERKLLLRSSLLRILFEIKKGPQNNFLTNKQSQSKLIIDALEIINKSYCKNITVEQIAAELYVSASKLSHKFKNELNISVYKYITLKRLLYAQKLIKSGKKAADAAIKSGFCDYSSFYRIYKNHYGISPCQNKRKA